jgi:hypothetical protein
MNTITSLIENAQYHFRGWFPSFMTQTRSWGWETYAVIGAFILILLWNSVSLFKAR